MAFDGLMIAAIVNELSQSLAGGRIDKVFQPERDEIVLAIRAGGGNHRLLLTANAGFPRLHLTAAAKENPLTAPMFCMLLRKHIQGGRITGITQPNFERIVHIAIESFNEMGDLVEKLLVVEIMGKYSNIILVDGGVVLDSAKHVSYSQSSVRQILPGRPYVEAPSQNKINPLLLERERFLAIAESADIAAQKLIFQNYTGISPFSAGIICAMAEIDPEKTMDTATARDMAALFDAFDQVMTKVRVGEFTPYTFQDGAATPRAFAVISRHMYDNDHVRDFVSPSQMVEYYYAAKDNTSRIQQKSQDLRRHVQNLIERCVKKAEMHEKTMAEVAERESLRAMGELITANIYAIPAGAKSFTAINYYEEGMPEVDIALNPTKTAAENAQGYFAKYNKQKRTNVALQEQMTQNMEELEYLEGVRQTLEHAHDDADLAQIRQELAGQGLVKKQGQTAGKKQKEREQKAKPLHYISSDGHDIYVGKNNVQNDHLTLRFAMPDDIWLHTKSIPGSHVILRAKGGQVSQAALEEAAMLAAYYSKGRSGSLVPVDYCPRKQVKKPSGAKPGMVIYEGHRTAYVTPDEGKINAMEMG
ncbi:MAG: NFACT family protein [Defluviitaleaceae bacterium]|nr:NFACT family protein [Defluviitaleaceae bacterium]